MSKQYDSRCSHKCNICTRFCTSLRALYTNCASQRISNKTEMLAAVGAESVKKMSVKKVSNSESRAFLLPQKHLSIFSPRAEIALASAAQVWRASYLHLPHFKGSTLELVQVHPSKSGSESWPKADPRPTDDIFGCRGGGRVDSLVCLAERCIPSRLSESWRNPSCCTCLEISHWLTKAEWGIFMTKCCRSFINNRSMWAGIHDYMTTDYRLN